MVSPYLAATLYGSELIAVDQNFVRREERFRLRQ